MKIEKLPFYWRLKEKGSPNIVPDYRPYEFDFDEKLQLIIQKRDTETLSYLEEIYRAEYNIGYLQDSNEIAKPYGKDFMDFIQRALRTWGAEVRTILEIGCGGCTILEQLANQGYEVIGVDPSPIAAREGVRKGIRVINEFFPTPHYTGNVDLIFHVDVQEHVADVATFLSDQRKQLSDRGLLIISLPDCNESIERGDISLCMHQHLNYFDNDSLKNTVEAAGLEVLCIETAQYGGSLYCCARNKVENTFQSKTGVRKFEKFSLKVDAVSKGVTTQIAESLNDTRRSVGFYVPLRTLPYISLLKRYDGFRFFDDTHHWYNCAFDGTEVYIENFNDLKSRPVDDLFIMSLTFGDLIKSKISSELEISNIKTLRGLIENI